LKHKKSFPPKRDVIKGNDKEAENQLGIKTIKKIKIAHLVEHSASK